MANVIKLCSILVFFLFNLPILILSVPLVPCYFIFGDSLVDNGNNNNLQTAAKVNYHPYGIDFPGGATGRFSNGRNLADFIAILLGFSNYIQPYSTVNDNDITRGVNFASGGAGILQETGSQLGEVIYLDKQLLHHATAVSKIATIQGNASFTKEYLTKCIYTVGMGNNDYIQNYFAPDFDNSSRLFTPDQFATILIAQYSKQLQTLYSLGARKIAVFGLGPSGCTPSQVAKFGTNGTQCVTKINDAIKFFNDKLQPLADYLNSKFTDAKFIVVSATNTLPSIPGILVSNSPCCKVFSQGGTRGQCLQALPNTPPCLIRLQYIFFDGFHPTEKKMAPHLLHGTLHATIYEVDRLNTGCGFNLCSKNAGPLKKTRTVLSQVKRLVLCRPEIIGSKLYATVDLEKARVARTRMIENEPSNPRWYEFFHIYCAHMVSNIIFTVKDGNPLGATLLGRAYLPVEDIINGFEIDKWLEILDEDRIPVQGGSRIHVKLQFLNVNRDNNWSQGIKSGSYGGVPYAFFRQRQGCNITLYPDAHVLDDNITAYLNSEGFYEPQRCWEDVFDAINNAKHLIYITGWSVYTKITLIRDLKRPKPGGDLNLGDLLKKKANEGVNVLMLVWDDRSSLEAFKKDGLMATHDQETGDFFRNTNVHCVLCPRNPDNGRSIIQGIGISTMFTHHQKTIVVDSEAPEEGPQWRRIISFVGGIDLCDGRYDTHDHSLFRTLDNVHHDDFHQPNFPGSSIRKGGPREPWHDIHCKLEGPVAWDVLYNFEQRWKKQVGNQFVFSLTELDKFLIRPSAIKPSRDPDTWNVQLFRSIDGGAASGFPEKPEDAATVGLVSGKDNIIDRSIQDAYIHAIRRAKDFIYIENQYFLGSSYGWNSKDVRVEDIGALHLIAKELSLKIISKIEAGERFAVYIVIPMWPEGIPESGSVQAILDWQRRTMEMMYKDIAHALQVKGIDENPRDYLTFFCLGNREVKNPGEYAPSEQPEIDSDYSRAQESRRFMIYVHAKMMIVDDEYIIVGSANINQRSMDGGRDTEIAMGGYQPYHIATTQSPARGKVFGFRMALWLEHLVYMDDSFLQPHTLDCVRKVNGIAQGNWEIYSSPTFVEDLPGHLMTYPVAVSNAGEITTLPGFEFFPDTKARVLGTRSEVLPPIITT